jgi:chemotaxis protein CheX
VEPQYSGENGMNDINTLDLKDMVEKVTCRVFDTMLSMDVGVVAQPPSPLNGSRIVGSVGFAGDAVGIVRIHVDPSLARIMTAAMLGMEPDEVEGDEEMHDVIGEVSNMIGGDVKSRLCDSGFPCQLSIPSIISGNDFKIESKGWVKHEFLNFSCRQHVALVEVYIKSGPQN